MNRSTGRMLRLWVMPAAAFAVYLYFILRVLWRIGDEGTLVLGAQRVSEGALPYRDFFEVMGPGSFYWLALFFKLFGTTIAINRIVVGLTAVLTFLALLWMGRRLSLRHAMIPAVASSAIGVVQWPASNHHFDSNMAALLAFCCWLQWARNRNAIALLVCGFLAGITTTMLQQKGVLVVLALGACTIITASSSKDRLRACALLGGPYAAVGLAVLLYFFWLGGLNDLIYANIVWPATNYHKVNQVPYAYGLWNLVISSWAALGREVGGVYGAVLLAVACSPVYIIVACLPVLVGLLLFLAHRWTLKSPITPYLIVGTAVWLSEIHRLDITHLGYGAPVLLVCLQYCCEHIRRFPTLWLSRILACSTIAVALVTLLVALSARVRVDTRRGSVYIHRPDEALLFLNREVGTRTDVFVYPYYPMYYFLADLTNPTRYSILMYQINTRTQFAEAVDTLASRKVPLVLLDTKVAGAKLVRWFPGYQHPPTEQQVIEPWVERNYTLVRSLNGFNLYRKKRFD